MKWASNCFEFYLLSITFLTQVGKEQSELSGADGCGWRARCWWPDGWTRWPNSCFPTYGSRKQGPRHSGRPHLQHPQPAALLCRRRGVPRAECRLAGHLHPICSHSCGGTCPTPSPSPLADGAGDNGRRGGGGSPAGTGHRPAAGGRRRRSSAAQPQVPRRVPGWARGGGWRNGPSPPGLRSPRQPLPPPAAGRRGRAAPPLLRRRHWPADRRAPPAAHSAGPLPPRGSAAIGRQEALATAIGWNVLPIGAVPERRLRNVCWGGGRGQRPQRAWPSWVWAGARGPEGRAGGSWGGGSGDVGSGRDPSSRHEVYADLPRCPW